MLSKISKIAQRCNKNCNMREIYKISLKIQTLFPEIAYYYYNHPHEISSVILQEFKEIYNFFYAPLIKSEVYNVSEHNSIEYRITPLEQLLLFAGSVSDTWDLYYFKDKKILMPLSFFIKELQSKLLLRYFPTYNLAFPYPYDFPEANTTNTIVVPPDVTNTLSTVHGISKEIFPAYYLTPAGYFSVFKTLLTSEHIFYENPLIITSILSMSFNNFPLIYNINTSNIVSLYNQQHVYLSIRIIKRLLSQKLNKWARKHLFEDDTLVIQRHNTQYIKLPPVIQTGFIISFDRGNATIKYKPNAILSSPHKKYKLLLTKYLQQLGIPYNVIQIINNTTPIFLNQEQVTSNVLGAMNFMLD